MIVCIDTNVLLQARARGHVFFPILNSWVAGNYSIAVSTGILLEYEEVMTRLSGKAAWIRFARLLDLVELTNAGVIRVTPSYRFHVIGDDPDDNLFTDCAITAGAEYLITEDRHFLPLANAGYKPQPIKPQEFINRFGLSAYP
jgi:putative PIN family toxin of toxin-antitoxin system